MAYEVVMPYHLHMPSYFLETFTEYPFIKCIVKLYIQFEHEINAFLLFYCGLVQIYRFEIFFK